MDLIVLLVLMVIVVVAFKDAKCLVYFLGIVEIAFRVLTYIGEHIGIKEVSNFIIEYVPSSILDIIGRYSTGLFYDILSWVFALSFLLLDYYLIQYVLKKK